MIFHTSPLREILRREYLSGLRTEIKDMKFFCFDRTTFSGDDAAYTLELLEIFVFEDLFSRFKKKSKDEQSGRTGWTWFRE
jgi:hypothetical protein